MFRQVRCRRRKIVALKSFESVKFVEFNFREISQRNILKHPSRIFLIVFQCSNNLISFLWRDVHITVSDTRVSTVTETVVLYI